MTSLHLALDKLPPHINRLYIAFSAGIDSCVLLHYLCRQAQQYSLVLWHINHGLQSNADAMQQFAVDMAKRYQLDIRVDHLDLNLHQGNLEAKARQARYALFSAQLTQCDALLTAHHMNDQAETLMLNMMRGSGASGLRAIADLTGLGEGYLFRPLLDIRREEIESYAEEHALQWVDDPSNQSLQFDRNFLRHEILPSIKQRWPAVIQQLHRVSDWQKEQYQLLQELAQLDYEQALTINPFSAYTCLDINTLMTLSQPRQKNLIRYWVQLNNKPQLGFRKLQQLLKHFSASSDAMPMIEAEGYRLRCYQRLLFMVDEQINIKLPTQYRFDDEQEIAIEQLDLLLSRQTLLEDLGIEDKGQSLELRFRQHATTSANADNHRLKRLLQKHRVPPWLRSVTPLVYLDDRLQQLWLTPMGREISGSNN